MKIAMDKICLVFSKAFDVIEKEQLGASENHSMRVAALCIAMGKKLGYNDDMLSAIAVCGLFHDSALTEYHLSQKTGVLQEKNMVLHCEKGQSHVSWLPFKLNIDIDKFILHHHERGDGLGPFHLKENEISMETAIIAAADAVDATYHLQYVKAEKLPELREKILLYASTYSTLASIKVLIEVLDENLLETLRDENITQTMDRELPRWEEDVRDFRVIRAGGFIARAIDYKSEFTRMHTSQISNRAWVMAEHYGYDLEEKHALFLAASLHDIGKIATPIGILEKPGKLDDDEFIIIKQHVKNTLDWLGEIPDFELIRNWAANHHEKLGGFGYSRGINGNELDFNSRLMACIDIYQAVIEPRPYHGARTHEQTMEILYDMASKGQIDEKIVKDMDIVMAKYSMQQVPSPIQDDEACAIFKAHEKTPVNGYRCNICGYFHEGDGLPEDFICPVCKHSANYFTRANPA
ncbi:MAG: HD domain-containing protein [Oscillospiraceae bacterium]|nr:HD domain-containing protein [Oscillospiraceae bacterium]